MICKPLLVVWSLNVAPLAIVKLPEPASLSAVFGLVSFKLIWTKVPVAVLVPPNWRVRPPSSPKPELNAAPPAAFVVPDPLCVPPENTDRPDAVNVPVPLSSPPD